MTENARHQRPLFRNSMFQRPTNLIQCSSMIFILLFYTINIPVCDARWMDSSVSYTFRGSKAEAYRLYSSLDLHPTWSPWLEKVDYDRKTGLSVWTLSYLGLRYSWRAKNTIEDPPNTIQWEALDGLPNRGKVEFVSSMEEDSSSSQSSFEKTTINLTVSYELPEAAALVLKALGSMAKGFINNTLLADLKRFHKRMEEHREVNKGREDIERDEDKQQTDHYIIPPADL